MLLCQDLTVKEIGAILKLSPKTADSHKTRLYKKSGVHSRIGLYRWALARGLVEAPEKVRSVKKEVDHGVD